MSYRIPMGSHWVFDHHGRLSIWKVVPKPADYVPVEETFGETDDIYVEAIWERQHKEEHPAKIGQLYTYSSASMEGAYWWRIDEEDIPLFLLEHAT